MSGAGGDGMETLFYFFFFCMDKGLDWALI